MTLRPELTILRLRKVSMTKQHHPDIAEKPFPNLGAVKDVVLRSVLGFADYPQWVIDRAREEGA
jgi:hypothetical protein